MRRPLKSLDSCPGLYEALKALGWRKTDSGVLSPKFFRFGTNTVEALMVIPNEDIPKYLVLDAYDAVWPPVLGASYLRPNDAVGELKQILSLRLELC